MDIKLHPLVLLNISDHFTRSLYMDSKLQVTGVILGSITARNIEIWNSFEVPVTGDGVVDLEYFKAKFEQYKQIFAEYEFLGWYSTAPKPSEDTQMDIDTSETDPILLIHHQFLTLNESCLCVLLDTHSKSSKSLPLRVLETVRDTTSIRLEPVVYRMETNDAERVAVGHVAMNVKKDDNKMVAGLSEQVNALEMLYSRIEFVVEFLREVVRGTIVPDKETLREIWGLVSRLPAAHGDDEFRREFSKDYSDVMAMSYLTMITKSAEKLDELTMQLTEQIKAMQQSSIKKSGKYKNIDAGFSSVFEGSGFADEF